MGLKQSGRVEPAVNTAGPGFLKKPTASALRAAPKALSVVTSVSIYHGATAELYYSHMGPALGQRRIFSGATCSAQPRTQHRLHPRRTPPTSAARGSKSNKGGRAREREGSFGVANCVARSTICLSSDNTRQWFLLGFKAIRIRGAAIDIDQVQPPSRHPGKICV